MLIVFEHVLTYKYFMLQRGFYLLFIEGGRRGRDRIVVGFTTTYAINTYYH